MAIFKLVLELEIGIEMHGSETYLSIVGVIIERRRGDWRRLRVVRFHRRLGRTFRTRESG